MAGLLARLLELSRLEAGELAPAWRTLALRETFDHCAVKFAQAARDKGLRLRFAASRARIRSDAGMLQSILDNLVANAVRYTQRGGIVVGVRKRAATLAIEVWDSGPGIPAERIELLFEAYRRFDDTAGGSEGHGLGLALVKKQCDLLGWGVAVRSAPGRGTVFCVTLPRASDVHG
jgi:signal transduction histidine kinase